MHVQCVLLKSKESTEGGGGYVYNFSPRSLNMTCPALGKNSVGVGMRGGSEIYNESWILEFDISIIRACMFVSNNDVYDFLLLVASLLDSRGFDPRGIENEQPEKQTYIHLNTYCCI